MADIVPESDEIPQLSPLVSEMVAGMDAFCEAIESDPRGLDDHAATGRARAILAGISREDRRKLAKKYGPSSDRKLDDRLEY